jgi:hypothetical protein
MVLLVGSALSACSHTEVAARSSEPQIPSQFPELTSEDGVADYITTMFSIMARATKSLRPYEQGTPLTIGVTDSKDCIEGGTQIGDHAEPYAGIPVPPMAACQVKGKLVVLYGPHTVWAFAQEHGQSELQGQIRALIYVDYLIQARQLAHPDDGLSDPMVPACVRGRINGGLRDTGYMPSATIDKLYEADDSEWGTLYREARDQGTCTSQ